MNENEYETVASYFWINDAQMAKIELEANGIECEIQDSELAAANPFLSNAAGGIKLNVRKKDINNARLILSEIEKNKKETYKPTCPECESIKVTERRLPAWGLLLSVFTLGFWFVAAYRPYSCDSCGFKWR